MTPIAELRGTNPTSEQAIERLEHDLGVALPADYRAFLLRTNGGVPYPEDAYRHERYSSILSKFYSVEHERVSFTIAQKRLQLEDRMPTDLLAIANDLGGSQICLGIGDDNRGKVYLWMRADEVRPGRKPDYSNVGLIADTFDEFLSLFYNSDEVDPDLPT